MKKPKIKEFKIKVPVYSTEKQAGPFKYNDVIGRLTKELELYNVSDSIARVAFRKSNKTQQKVIKKVDHFKCDIGDAPNSIPALLLKVTTFNTNLLDGYTEEPDGVIRVFGKTTQLGYEHNYMLF